MAIQRLDRVVITEKDRALIKDFVNFKTAAQNIGLARQDKYLRSLTTLAERYLNGRAYSSLTQEDVMEIVLGIGRSKLSEWTKHDYRVTLKTFMIWAGKEKEVRWVTATKPRRLPEEILSEEDVSKLINSALSPRDKAFIACLYEGGFRIGELGGLRIKDIDFDRYGAIAMVTGKTGMRRVRLIWSMPYIAQWLEAHPRRSEREAPVWVKMSGEAMIYNAINKQLHALYRRASEKYQRRKPACVPARAIDASCLTVDGIADGGVFI